MRYVILLTILLFPLNLHSSENKLELEELYHEMQKEQQTLNYSQPENRGVEINKLRSVILELQVENGRLKKKLNRLEHSVEESCPELQNESGD